MLKLLSLFIMMLAATSAMAQPTERLRQFNAETTTSVGEISTALKRRLPKSVIVIEEPKGVSIQYTGNATPAPLADFLKSAFSQLDPKVIATGQTVSLSFVASEYEDTTDLSLMVLARFPAPEVPLLKGAGLMLDGTGMTPCTGHMVLAHPDPVDEIAPAYREHLENEGFAFPDAEPDETSFFVGYRQDCELALYLQDQQGTSLIVIRYLED